GRNSIAFKNDVGEVTLDNGKKFYAASTSIIAAEMLELMRSESPWMVGATFVMVFLLMIFSFRSLRWSIIAMLPLVVGLLWLFGIMMLTGMMFNFYNLVVLPAILGIGEDNGVHLAHRYREEGRNSMWDVLSSTGQHITIGSVTTMLGFSGLIFTNHPGLQSLGEMAFIGIGLTLIAALTFLPALIQLLEDRDWIRF
ncbi:MAG TPA: MMPL family transporter, partial [Balneolaceae bacterium]|nr:MMPL family transporter [Balneolaceae bacterium]